MMKNVVLLGSTGSIGRSTCEVIERFSSHFRLVGMSAGCNIDLFEEQVGKFRPSYVSMSSQADIEELKRRLNNPKDIKFFSGESGLVEVASCEEGDIVLSAVVGKVGLIPVVKAIEAKKDIAVANKEVMVMAGEIITKKAREAGVRIMPVDSEHSAIFQCIEGNDPKSIEKIILTASGGAFLRYSSEQLKNVTPKEALRHPNWKMGNKVTVDSATLMNKGLEVIEAHWFFGGDIDKIEVVVHPQSIVHSMVQYVDGAVIAQLSVPDMKLPILYSLSYPQRLNFNKQRINFSELGSLSFEPPDMERFPCLDLAFEALKVGKGCEVVLNAADEVAVEGFLAGQLRFTQITEVVECVLNRYVPHEVAVLEDVLQVDDWARKIAEEKIRRMKIC